MQEYEKTVPKKKMQEYAVLSDIHIFSRGFDLGFYRCYKNIIRKMMTLRQI